MSEICDACFEEKKNHLPDGACPKLQHSGFTYYDPEADEQEEECLLCGMCLESECCNEFPECQEWT